MGELIAGVDAGARDYRYTLLSKELAARGHEVVRWTSTFEHVSKKYRFPASRTLELCPRLKVRLLHGLPAYRANISLARFRQQRAVARLFAAEAASWPQPDLVYTGIPVPELSEQAVLFARRRGVPVVVDAQDQWPDIYLSVFPTPVRWLARATLNSEFSRSRRVFRGANAVTAVSDTYLRWALGRAGRCARSLDGVYPLGFAPAASQGTLNEEDKANLRRQWGIPSGAWVALFLGTFGNFYDVETMARAARLLHERRARHIHVVMVGDGEKMPLARALTAGVPTITVPGWVDHAATRALSAISSAGLCAYGRHALQSIPYKPLEYMAAGLALVSSLPGEMREIIEASGCGAYYQAGDPESLVTRLLELAAQPERCAAMGQRARDLFAERFNAQVIYPRLAARLESAAREAKGHVVA